MHDFSNTSAHFVFIGRRLIIIHLVSTYTEHKSKQDSVSEFYFFGITFFRYCSIASNRAFVPTIYTAKHQSEQDSFNFPQFYSFGIAFVPYYNHAFVRSINTAKHTSEQGSVILSELYSFSFGIASILAFVRFIDKVKHISTLWRQWTTSRTYLSNCLTSATSKEIYW